MNQKQVTKHFNTVAKNYDSYKRRNLFFYYSTLKKSLKKVVPPGSHLLDYGTGTGEILNFLSPASGVGFDPSREMVKIASQKFKNKKNLKFVNSTDKIRGDFDYIILVDVIEHLPAPALEFKKIRKFMGKETKLVVSFVDTSWEWFPKILELMHLKMPEGPHKRIGYGEVLKIGKKAGLKLIKPAHSFSPIKIIVFTKT